MEKMHFSFSDLISGYVECYDWENSHFTVKTVDAREFVVQLTDTTYAELVRNLGEPYADCTPQLKDMLTDSDRFIFVYGIFYHEGGNFSFEAKHIVFIGQEAGEFCFERQDWWIRQIRKLAEFYLKAQFDNGGIDYTKYRTSLTLEGAKMETIRQETDTISRMIYGFSTCFLLTGEDVYLEAAEQGVAYLREHLRSVDSGEDIAFWYHAVDLLANGKYKKILASEFGDDYDAIPAYEQIYALAGPVQTFRVTGDPAIERDLEMTVNLFERYFRDSEHGGYWSHIDPVTFDGRSEKLGKNHARKNWNSIGDHAPAYLINAWLATGEERYKTMLEHTADLIAEHFPDYEHSPFVEEKFHADWTKDKTWGWQQNRAVVGHNLKIAWNLMRIHSLIPKQPYVELAERIADILPRCGLDLQRGGWYDVVARTRGPGEEFQHFTWHDRKAWWQQEQGILAFYILAGTLKKPEYLKLARESAAFYNAWFPDHDSGGVYFNVLANGLPYLLGNERLKASHSMSGYHSFELCYLCAVYSNLLVHKQPMDFYFKPLPDGFKDHVLRVQPDILPPGSVRISQVWIDGLAYGDFDAQALTVTLPQRTERVTVKVRLVPYEQGECCEIQCETCAHTVKITLKGCLGPQHQDEFRETILQAAAAGPQRVILVADELDGICRACVNAIIFARQKLSDDTEIVFVNAKPDIQALFTAEGETERIVFATQCGADSFMQNNRVP